MVAPLSSVICTVKLLVPAVAGVPLITPVDALRLKPPGSVPTEILQLYGVLPPVAVNVWLYATFAVAWFRLFVVMLKPEYIVIDNAWVAVAPLASVALTVKLLVPAVVGVPLISPVLVLSDSPAGRLPVAIAHVIGLLPPLDVSV